LSRWWRAYDEAVDDPKLQRLGPALGWAWFNLMCIASKHGGVLPSIGDIAFKLRTTEQKAAATLTALVTAGLFERIDDGSFAPHNWEGRQFQSDVSNDRVKRYRERKRNVTPTVTVTPPETEQNTEAERTSLRSDADASGDPRTKLFREGLSKLAMLTGKGPDACRSFVGKCLKAADDNAIVVLGLIEDAERNRVADPAGWIVGCLKAKGNSNGKPTVHDAAKELSRRLSELDEPAPSGLCEQAGGSPVRLLSSR